MRQQKPFQKIYLITVIVLLLFLISATLVPAMIKGDISSFMEIFQWITTYILPWTIVILLAQILRKLK